MTGYALNLPSPGRDQDKEPSRGGGFFRGHNFMQSIRPDKSDPIPLRNPPQSMGHIMIRFVGLLVLAVVVLALAWNR
jgi:hypothetical protein